MKKGEMATSKSRMKWGISTDPADIKRIMREDYKQLYRQTFDNIGKVDQIPQKAPATTIHPI